MALGHFCLIHFGFPLSVSSTISPCRLRLRVALTRRIGGRNSDHWVGEKSTFNFCSSLKEYIACTSNNKQCLASVLLDLTDWEIIVRWTTNPHPLLAVQVSTFTGSFLQVQVKFGGEKNLMSWLVVKRRGISLLWGIVLTFDWGNPRSFSVRILTVCFGQDSNQTITPYGL